MTSPDKPLVTFALFAYNQERFIREAVEGAFSQTYSPLEIILSDDCSTDHTFEIMNEMAKAYKGPHEIIPNRNERNLGIGAHINRVMELARGQLIVAAAGDDISKPERTKRLYGAWAEGMGKVKYLYSDIEIINSDGDFIKTQHSPMVRNTKDIIDNIKHEYPCILGCSEAWDKDTFIEFGPLSTNVVAEDRVIPFRANVLGTIRHIPDRLVKYRRHSTNIYNAVIDTFAFEAYQKRAIRILNIHQRTYEQYLKDLEHSTTRRNLSPKIIKRAKSVAEIRRKQFLLKQRFMNASGLEKSQIIYECLQEPLLVAQAGRFLVRWLLPGLYRALIKRNALKVPAG